MRDSDLPAGPLFIVAEGTDGPDVFNGGSGADTYSGKGGRDTIRGGGGNDLLDGGADDDNIDGQDGEDTLLGQSGNDFLQGNTGNDNINGGAGDFDTATYNAATSGVSVDLRVVGPQAVGGGQGVDSLVNVEGLQGSFFNDTLIGNDANNTLEGLQGDDVLDGVGGRDHVEYSGASSGVTVNLNLTTPQNIGGGQGVDTLRNIENIGGSFFADTLTGNAADNYITGHGGGDRITGNGGFDTADYRGLPGGVIVNLALGGGNAITPTGTDTLSSIEGVGGSSFNDTLTGDGNSNTLAGRPGDDRLDGAGGFDSVDYYEAVGGVKVDLTITSPQNVGGGEGVDTLLNFENIYGSFFADTLSGDANNNSFSLRGLNGDVVDGRGGFDRVDYLGATDGGVSANLVLGTAVHLVGTDTLTSIEAVTGTNFADTLVGGAENNTFAGAGGDDSIDGGAGQDGLDFYNSTGGVTVNLTLTTAQVVGGGEGTDTILNVEQIFASFFGDTLTGTAGDNYFSTRGGGDRVDGGGGFDTVDYGDLTAGVIVDTATGSGITITGNDTLTSIERVNGTNFADTITGDANNNGFYLRGGDDRLDGGAGTDSIDFFNATAGFRLDLSNGGPQDLLNGHGVKTVLNIEQVFGSFFADTITGTAGSNYFSGRGGGDRVDGGAGSDSLDYNDLSGGVNASLLTGFAITPTGNDTLIGLENLNGSRFSDTLVGDAGQNVFTARTGDDIIDGGAGTDTVDLSDATSGVTVDLNSAAAQNVGGGLGLDTILNIENIGTTRFADTVTGTAGSNFLTTRGGGDRVDGGAGFDTVDYRDLTGGVSANLGLAGPNAASATGIDTLIGIEAVFATSFADTLVGDATNNSFLARSGDDVLDGGAGFDTATFFDASGGVTVSLGITTAQVIGADQGTDTLVNFEGLTGSNFNDTLTGDAGNNTLNGRIGDDRLDGAGGIDTANYNEATGGVNVSLAITTAQAVGADQGVDTLLNIENLTSGAFNDTLTGDAAGNQLNGNGGNNSLSGMGGNDNLLGGIGNDFAQGGDGFDVLQGQAGADTLMGGADGDQLLGGSEDDLLDGGDGTDLAVYSIATGAVKVSLAISGAQAVGADQESDTLVNIEQLFGSNFNDTLTGDGGNNYLGGSLGDDSLVGGGGQDYLAGGIGNDILDGSATDEVLAGRNTVGGDYGYYDDASSGVTVDLSIAGGQAVGGGLGIDTLISIENLRGSNFGDVLKGDGGINYLQGLSGADTLQGAGGDDVLEGGAGDDRMDGGDGSDLVSYFTGATGGVTVDLGAAGGQDVGGGLGVDTLISIESLYGSTFGDRVTGTGDANYVDGQGGDDTIMGGGASDTVLGAAGNDVLAGEGGDDTLSGEAGNDSLAGGAGFDVATFSGARADYQVTVLGGGMVTVTDLRAGSPDGADTLSDVERMRFSDGDFAPNSAPTGAATATLANGIKNVPYDVSKASLLAGFSDADAGDVLDVTGLSANHGAVTTNPDGSFRITPDAGYFGPVALTYAVTDGHGGSVVGSTSFVLADAGTEGPDAYFGTGGPDVYRALGGSDSVFGGNGADLLDGDDGDDFLRGQSGDDTLRGGAGNDFLSGAAGNDVLDGGAGLDRTSFFDAPDGVHIDLTIAGPQDTGFGIDTLVSIEHVSGTVLSDTLSGDGQANWLWGSGGGNDMLSGRGGDDLLMVGAGNHTLDGGSGIDTVALPIPTDTTGPVTISLALQGAAQATGQGSMLLTGIENLSGTQNGDTLAGDGGTNLLAGYFGDDSLAGADGDDLLLGDGSVDLLGNGGSGSIVVTADYSLMPGALPGGNDTLDGGAGADTLNGGGGDDSLSGDLGDDRFVGGLGNDTIDGGPGDDVAIFSGLRAAYTITYDNVAGRILVNGADGADVLTGVSRLQFDDQVVTSNFAPVANPDVGAVNEDATVLIDVLANDTDLDVGDTRTLVSVSATEKGASVSIVGGKVSYIASADSFDLLKTGQSVVDSFSYTMRDAAGSTSTATVQVTVNGVADAPTKTGGGAADTLGGTAGDEKLDGGGGDDSLSAGEGADVLVGGLGNDTMDGGAGIDSLSGGDGGDRVVGGLGDDILAGGRGADLFVFGPSFGHDTLIDFKPGEDDIFFQGAGLTSFADLTAHAAQVGANVLITLGSGDSLQLNGVTLASLAPADFLFV